MQTQIKEVMIHKQNPLTGDWLCYIPKTSQAYYCKTKKQAKSFCDKVNNAFSTGELFFDKNRKLQINQP